MAPGFLFAQFFFHVSMLALEPYSIMPFIKKTMRGSFFFWVSFNYCFISLLKYVQRFEFALENARSELGYSGSDNLVGRPQFWFGQSFVWLDHNSGPDNASHPFVGRRSRFSRIHPLSGSQGRCSGRCHIQFYARSIFNNNIDSEDYER